jgi:acyl transferase domain-containing protein
MARRRSVRGESHGIELAIEEIRRLHDQVESLGGRGQEPVAVLGAGLRLPRNLRDQNGFWRLLAAGQNAVTEIPRDRWDANAYYDPDPDRLGKMNARHGAFLEGVNEFDAAFFGISSQEANIMDPQQRILLEVCWEALENAAVAPSSLAGTAAGVWIGSSNSDHWRTVLSDAEAIDRFAIVGNAAGEAAGRVSWMLDARGPSQVVDTGSSSSLVAVHLACESLRRGESTLALAGGINLILTPELNIGLSKLHMLAPDGLAKPFDSRANGSVRGEGCVVFVLKLLSRAISDNDRILAVIRGSAVNQNGRTTGWAVPNARAQAGLIRRVLEAAGVQPMDVAFVEANGAGTLWGDSVELQVLEATLCSGRPLSEALAIGSVKTNLGDLEAAAGAAGLLKAILALRHRAIPGHLSLRRKIECIDWRQAPLYIPTELTPWPQRGSYMAGVSSFGNGGANTHVIVEAPPVRQARQSQQEKPLHILALSARREVDLERLVPRYRELLERPDAPTADICYTANAGRTHFAWRFCAIGRNNAELAAQLGQFRGGIHAFASPQPPIAFLYPGEGSGFRGMGLALYENSPAFRRAFDRCVALAPSPSVRDLLSALFDPENALFERSGSSLPALFGVEYAVTELWRSWGIEPAFVTGRGAGEYAAACAAGMISLADGLRLAGALEALLASLPPGIEVASPRLRPLLDVFDRAALQITIGPPRIAFASSFTGRIIDPDTFDRDYWRRHAQASGRFAEAAGALHARGARIFLTAGPQTAQARSLSVLVPKPVLALCSLRAGEADWPEMLNALKTLYLAGIHVDWVGFDRDYARSKIEAPTYPFQRTNHLPAGISPR